MKTCKKLLAIALVAAVLLTTLVSGLVVSAAEPYSVTIADTELTAGEDATVNVTVDFNGDAISALHMLATVTTALKIEDAAIVSVDYADGVTDPGDAELDVPYLRINTDGKNLDAGKILFESGVDGAVKATKVVFALTFKAVAEGIYPIAVSVESTDYNEANFAVLTDDANIVAVAPHVCEAGTPVDNGDGTHDVPCTGCDKLVVDNETHKFADGVCSVCGAKEPVVEPECDHANAELVYSVVDGACVTTKICACGEYEEVIATIAAQRTGQDTGIRIFRAPILDAGLAFAFRTETAYSAGYTDVYGVFTKECFVRDGSDTLAEPEVTEISAVIDPDYQGKRYKFLYEGIRSYEMCSNINIKIFGTNADGDVCFLGTLDYAFANYIQNNYAAATGTLKTLLGDLAFYGAAAQDYFEYHYSAKPNAGIEDNHSELPTTFDTTDKQMDGGITISKAPDLANKVLINFRFNQADVKAYGSDLRFEVDYIDAKGNAATFVKNFDEFEIYQTNRYQVVFDQLVAARINDVVTAKVVTGENTVIGQLEYTLEKYAYNRFSGADNGKPLCILTQALVNYGDAAKAHFG